VVLQASRARDRLVLELNEPLRTHAAYLIAICRYLGLPVVVAEARRSSARQAALYAQGRTAPGNIVTWSDSSKHTTGDAIDIAFDLGQGITWPEDRRYWDAAAVVGDYLGLRRPAVGRGDLGHYEL